MKNIIFPFDKNLDNRSAFVYLMKLGRKFGSVLTLLHAYDADADVRKEWNLVNDEILGLKGFFLSDHANIGYDLELSYKVKMVSGRLGEMTLKELEHSDSDLLILTLPRHGSMENEKFGAMIKLIFNQLHKPMLLVPEGSEFIEPKTIGYVTTIGSELAYRRTLQYTELFRTSFAAKLHVVNVNGTDSDSQPDIIRKVNDTFPNENVSSYLTERVPDFMTAIRRTMDRKQMDLLIVESNIQLILDNIFNPSYGNEIAFNEDIPLFLIPRAFDIPIDTLTENLN